MLSLLAEVSPLLPAGGNNGAISVKVFLAKKSPKISAERLHVGLSSEGLVAARSSRGASR